MGYATGERDIAKAKCRIKLCCITRGLCTCADCPDYNNCSVIQVFHTHASNKYGKYRQAVVYIKEHGYDAFLQKTAGWKNAYGKY
jgi:hypothetical protein